ncbi:MAG TPA: prenyltransferase/squalene oxidase repeat-containing protein, partial [Pirellulales bacterium]|nr:prenyltransferase/squalene oxidase repeat-containing protein [Pirellulales bacterium]
PGAIATADDPSKEQLVEPDLRSDLWLHAPSWLTSMVAHLSLVLLLALISNAQRIYGPSSGDVDVFAQQGSETGTGLEDLPSQSTELSQPLELSELTQAGPQAVDLFGPITSDSLKVDLSAMSIVAGTGGTALGAGVGGAGTGEAIGNSLEMRLDPNSRARLGREGGGTPESEYAVEQALRWLAEHQNYDGSWTFEHQKSPKCHGSCRDPGYAPGKIAATSLALLPFLGTGQTHRDGQYKKTIDLGLRFLTHSMQIQGDLGSLHELGGQMYGHGLGSIVLCEAYGMTHDPVLQGPAQAAVNYIVAAQDTAGGGWRYVPGQPGDTSVVGWQMMALRSAKMAYLRVPSNTLRKAGYFLDYVQGDKGATYGYTGPEAKRPATTAIGLLCRMYLGWKQDQPALVRGVHILSQLGPSIDKTSIRNNMYYNYYATQVMHHFGGYPWEQWNRVMREYLIQTQSKRGHETGSWFYEGEDHGGPAGGRLYCTAMAAMTLEVYYRYMPLYREESVKGIPGRD